MELEHINSSRSQTTFVKRNSTQLKHILLVKPNHTRTSKARESIPITNFYTFVFRKEEEMASALEQLLGASVVDGSGKTVAVSSLAGNDKVVGQYIYMRSLHYIKLVHGQVTIIFVVSGCLSVCLSVCLFVQSFSQPSLIRFRSN